MIRWLAIIGKPRSRGTVGRPAGWFLLRLQTFVERNRPRPPNFELYRLACRHGRIDTRLSFSSPVSVDTGGSASRTPSRCLGPTPLLTCVRSSTKRKVMRILARRGRFMLASSFVSFVHSIDCLDRYLQIFFLPLAAAIGRLLAENL